MISTDKLENKIKSKDASTKLIENNIVSKTPTQIIEDYRTIKDISKNHIIEICDFDKKNAYKYLNGDRKLKRDMFLKILISMDLKENEVQHSLKYAGYAQLYVKNERDVIIYKSIVEGLKVDQINKKLKEKGMLSL